jgi:hypothetical protein
MYGLRDTCRFYTNSRGGGISHVWFEFMCFISFKKKDSVISPRLVLLVGLN